MISTESLMAGKALLTAAALLGFCVWQLRSLRRMKQRDAAARTHREAPEPTRVSDRSA